MKTHSLLKAVTAAIVLAVAAGCGSGGGGTTVTNGAGANIPGEPLGTLTLNPLAFKDMEKMVGRTFYIRADRGLAVGKKYAATLNGTDGLSDYHTGWLTTLLTVGSGDSGSPTYDEKGAVSGALAFGFDGNSSYFGVTSIDDMMWAADHESEDIGISRGRAAGKGRPLAGYAMGGLDPHRLDMLTKRAPALAARLSRYRQLSAEGTRSAAPAPGRAGNTLQPGETFAVMAVEGPDVVAYAYGSVTMPYKNRYLCWGHPLFWAGSKQAYPVKRTSFVSMVSSTFGSFKHSVPYGEPIGTMTGDLQYCVVVDTRVTPDVIPVTYTYTIGSKTWTSTPATLYKVARMDPFDVLIYAALGPIETASHQLGAYDLAGSGKATVVITMKDGTTVERSGEIDSSDQLLGDLWYEMIIPYESWDLTQADINNIKGIDITLLISDKKKPPVEE